MELYIYFYILTTQLHINLICSLVDLPTCKSKSSTSHSLAYFRQRSQEASLLRGLPILRPVPSESQPGLLTIPDWLASTTGVPSRRQIRVQPLQAASRISWCHYLSRIWLSLLLGAIDQLLLLLIEVSQMVLLFPIQYIFLESCRRSFQNVLHFVLQYLLGVYRVFSVVWRKLPLSLYSKLPCFTLPSRRFSSSRLRQVNAEVPFRPCLSSRVTFVGRSLEYVSSPKLHLWLRTSRLRQVLLNSFCLILLPFRRQTKIRFGVRSGLLGGTSAVRSPCIHRRTYSSLLPLLIGRLPGTQSPAGWLNVLSQRAMVLCSRVLFGLMIQEPSVLLGPFLMARQLSSCRKRRSGRTQILLFPATLRMLLRMRPLSRQPLQVFRVRYRRVPRGCPRVLLLISKFLFFHPQPLYHFRDLCYSALVMRNG